jgi:hypothetical protein
MFELLALFGLVVVGFFLLFLLKVLVGVLGFAFQVLLFPLRLLVGLVLFVVMLPFLVLLFPFLLLFGVGLAAVGAFAFGVLSLAWAI